MSDNRRDQILACIEREFIGPDPVEEEGCLQENGEEILSGDPPRVRYMAGILFPKEAKAENADLRTGEVQENELEPEEDIEDTEDNSRKFRFSEPDQAEELINCSNAYKQSAMSITCALRPGSRIIPHVRAAAYSSVKYVDSGTGKESMRYLRTPIVWDNDKNYVALPTKGNPIVNIRVAETELQFDITWRYHRDGCDIITFTLENLNDGENKNVHDGCCFFQVGFSVTTDGTFSPLPESGRINAQDLDYLSNQLLYRNVHNYAIGHGCAADWDEKESEVKEIKTAIFPTWEVKPIVPAAIDGVTLSMVTFGPYGSVEETMMVLNRLCDNYEIWIDELDKRKTTLESRLVKTAERHIANCKTCLARMRSGVELLKTNRHVQIAFQYMNLAMLQQQLHYNLPLQQWEEDENEKLKLNTNLRGLPDPTQPETWWGNKERYGKWRPFQLAFILMNLRSMADRTCDEREIIDLIWFPTGGGKTEAYLGLSAYTIFIRRLMNVDDDGTAILMRYTLRLLTAQQYERASAMICACELIRREHEDMFGKARISIGLWVGGDTTPNHMNGSKGAVEAFDKLKAGKSESNPFVMLKCPWCGAQMGPVRCGRTVQIQGYKKVIGPNRSKLIRYVCSNTSMKCEFSSESYPLPLHIVDDEIYKVKPTLLLGTVDKFAMLPFRPEAQKLFGIDNGTRVTAPDLIIQDELHLISGPLGSMVGHYEMMIDVLSTTKEQDRIVRPKIIASTATISRAKEQCRALYNCGDKVFQFPPSGLDYSDSFFAVENKDANGRKYVGIFAEGSSSDTTTAIRLFSSLLYAAKDMKVENEEQRDAYWTNMGYFNSLRELGQAQTWIHADIEQYLDTMYKRRHIEKKMPSEEYRRYRRYIYRDEELTSRIPSDKVTASLANLSIRYEGPMNKEQRKEPAIDICLATNMISVGLDVSRLGLMTVSGQPKTTSEYIQATSRVGRDGTNAPGLVFVLYRPGRPRDRSHYEHFREYHSRLYCSVEPTSVTPFSSPVRERALHAVMVGMMRLLQDDSYNSNPPTYPKKEILSQIETLIRNRVMAIDPEELDATDKAMQSFMSKWTAWNPQLWEPKINSDFSYAEDLPLLCQWGRPRHARWGLRSEPTPTSMRNVDASCEAWVLENGYFAKEDE
ncbi:MAG: hypothetical protein IJG07_10270 [Prevotella sp.]|nr:hypothetical protein [Prevotella sp.]